jgi:hypothetical protein
MQAPHQEGPIEQVPLGAEQARVEGRLQQAVRVYREVVIRDGEFVPRKDDQAGGCAAAC